MPQHSTEYALFEAMEHINAVLKAKRLSIIVSLDIEGAFGSTSWPAIKCELKNRQCPINLIRWAEIAISKIGESM